MKSSSCLKNTSDVVPGMSVVLLIIDQVSPHIHDTLPAVTVH